ncbi:MAG: bifunctional aspartate kinase/homoserine dehydrogenase I [Bacteroidota bacterium]|nr:bifunctional aspartate kinase/homoserine dehydrogenase I [Bacteroidota bacterium]MDP4250183.1 bifunctional aspartate kinase/homoserine dehydrogenase I [Bacteroidota bacterium]
MQVLKFGGSSVANAVNISKTVQVIRQAILKEKTIVVVSAFGGMTDILLQCGSTAARGDESYKDSLILIEQRHLETVRQLIPVATQSGVLSMVKKICNELEDIFKGIFLLQELSDRTKDGVVAFGELLSSRILSAVLTSQGVENVWKDSRELIITDSRHGRAQVDFRATKKKMLEYFRSPEVSLLVVPGFIASDAQGVTTTLGRGGSDYTAAIYGSVLACDGIEIWTDVSGMMTADPRLVSNARVIPHISYQEAMELSHFGAKVIYPPTLQPVMSKGIPVWVKNTFAPTDPGTLIEKVSRRTASSIRGISSINQIALLSLEGSGMIGIPGFSKRLFEALSGHQINVILITQASSEHSICVGVDVVQASLAKSVIDAAFFTEINNGDVQPLIVELELAIIALVGDNMKSHPGISGKLFGVLGRNGINVRAIAQGSSERNISAVISTKDVQKAVNVLHEEFFEATYKQLNLFITGTGNVGKRLIQQLHQQHDYLFDQLRLQVRVTGVANSRRMLINEEGIDLNHWQELLDQGSPMNLRNFEEIIHSKNLRNSVFVDVTANKEVGTSYERLLQKSVAVVACNKIACSSPYLYYRKLKDLSKEFNAAFYFETNVGAGLPVIGTLNDLLRSGDKIRKIEAVLSGTLNFVFNHYNGKTSFAKVVRQAQDEGYTEPDPRLDLSGTDVMRKIMILAREAGNVIEMEDISNSVFLPASCNAGSVADFYKALEKEETHFKKLYEGAAAEGKKLKFVATYEKGNASVGLQHIDPAHDFYHLYGKDNIVVFYTDRYPEQPLVIKGAGAGAEVTASGVFADIIRAASA